jgi:hypothetical protein
LGEDNSTWNLQCHLTLEEHSSHRDPSAGERDGGLVKLLDFLPSLSLHSRFIPRNSLSLRLFLLEKYSANENETDAR